MLAVPVGFSTTQINATREAAILAGFNVLRTIHEPTAAAMAYGLHTHSQAADPRCALVMARAPALAVAMGRRQ